MKIVLEELKDYLIGKLYFKYKFIGVFISIFLAGWLISFITNLILALNYGYNEKLLNYKKYLDFTILTCISFLMLFITIIYLLWINCHNSTARYLILKINKYPPKKPIKNLPFIFFRLAYYTFNIRQKIQYQQKQIYKYLISFNEYV
ncbi:hypothetical protein WFS18_01960 [Ureaplasma parvum]|uniref:Uncharacterized protein n=3 Tax=Ureaplasma parvum TaxID=134821 RepID=A0AAC9T0B4_UREPR|nr:hypothetical protein [Ureaplasma parvum]pir/E82870/ hypothetical protein UU593 [imported] - Ureaplasma urealyticum [Ureaplasma urealyticum]AAF31007.1 unique hypothetical [Ureaplasma parvum serovar 3 str. ATCC 700970]ACA33201.1 conserved hypothetical protein [Ureaplasma parvum serovar 3 str. ATCC 27815]ASD24647.1 hypothetical protein CEG38_01880 [Ureaplasma parvum]ASD25081.1 hypothetical protein CEE64_01245 [Ureaplasma parvum]ASD28980.1 hypothetical protein CEG40_02385 [Ureaplasma parvum]